MHPVQIEFNLGPSCPRPARGSVLTVGGKELPLELVRHPRARRYVLRLTSAGGVRVTVPRGGTETFARQFAERQGKWILRQLDRRPLHPPAPARWAVGTAILFRGELVRLEPLPGPGETGLRFADQEVRRRPPPEDWRTVLEEHLRRLATLELPARVRELAAPHRLAVGSVSVRNQRSRWGSCSRRGTICLNWRLIQTPPLVRDYVILHELSHLREMNHSARFWKGVAALCPEYRQAQAWLKHHRELLG